jgi:antitoxin VapB
MGLNIKNPEVESLIARVAQLTGRSKTDAVRAAMEKELAMYEPKVERDLSGLRKWLEEEVWPSIPPEQRGKRLTREEEDEILGYGPGGV